MHLLRSKTQKERLPDAPFDGLQTFCGGLLEGKHNADAVREQRIRLLTAQLNEATDTAERRALWGKLKSEINNRSAAQVLQMERERGLVWNPRGQPCARAS